MENCLNFFSLVDRVTGVSKYWYFLCCCENFFFVFLSLKCVFMHYFETWKTWKMAIFTRKLTLKTWKTWKTANWGRKKTWKMALFNLEKPGKTWKMTPESLWPPWKNVFFHFLVHPVYSARAIFHEKCVELLFLIFLSGQSYLELD